MLFMQYKRKNEDFNEEKPSLRGATTIVFHCKTLTALFFEAHKSCRLKIRSMTDNCTKF